MEVTFIVLRIYPKKYHSAQCQRDVRLTFGSWAIWPSFVPIVTLILVHIDYGHIVHLQVLSSFSSASVSQMSVTN